MVSISNSIALKELGTINLQDIYNKLNSMINTANTAMINKTNKTSSLSTNSRTDTGTDTASNKSSNSDKSKDVTKIIETDNKNNIKHLSYNNISRRDIRNGWVDRNVSRSKQAQEFMRVGEDLLDLYIDENGNRVFVLLKEIRSLQDNNTIVIPEFVTSVLNSAFDSKALSSKSVRVIIRGSAKECGVIDLSELFRFCEATELEFIVEDSDRIRSMNNMFDGNENIKSVKMIFMNASFNNLITDDRVGPVDYMFNDCKNLERLEIYANTWGCQCDTRKTFTITNLLSGCERLEYVDLSGFECILNRAYIAYNLFSDCKSLQFIDLSFLKSKNLLELKNTFNNCNNLRGIDLSGLDADTEINCYGIFYRAYSLDGVATRNKSIIQELKRFDNEDLREHTKTIRNTVELSNGMRISLDEAKRRKEQLASEIDEYNRIYRLMEEIRSSGNGSYSSYPLGVPDHGFIEREMKARGMLW